MQERLKLYNNVLNSAYRKIQYASIKKGPKSINKKSLNETNLTYMFLRSLHGHCLVVYVKILI